MYRLKFVFHRAFVVTLLLALSFAIPITVRSESANGTHIRIDNFGSIDSGYYRGAQPKGKDYADLAASGIKTIINLIGDEPDPNEKSLTESNGMNYIQIPMTTHVAPTADQISEFLEIVNDPAKQPVYVHCVGGKHRTGVMTAVYRMTKNGWTSDQAFQEMKHYHFGADFLHSEFKNFVYSYYSQIQTVAKTAEPATIKTVQ